MLVALPIVMLLMDYWPIGRYQEQKQELGCLARVMALMKEKIPFFILAILSVIITIYAQGKSGSIWWMLPLRMRVYNAAISYLKYIYKTFWPSGLAVLYPLPSTFPLWQGIISLLVLLLVSTGAILFRRRHPYILVGWFWYLITLIPVIGIIQVGVQSMADRYSYIPLTGIFIIVAWGGSDVILGLKIRSAYVSLVASVIIILCALLTYKQIGHWKNSNSLYTYAIQVTNGNYIMHNNLGEVLQRNGSLDLAIKEFQESIRINSNYLMAHENLGFAFMQKGNFDSAINEYNQVLIINPNDVDALCNLGDALYKKGDLDSAIITLEEVLRINPDDTQALNIHGMAILDKENKNNATK